MGVIPVPSPTHQRQAVVERRAKVAALRLHGTRNQTQLAQLLGVSQATISGDFAALDEAWRERANVDHAKQRGEDLERIEAMIDGLWPQASKGGYLSVDRVVMLMERRAKLLGLDAPTKQQVSGDPDAPMTIVVRYEGEDDGGTAGPDAATST